LGLQTALIVYPIIVLGIMLLPSVKRAFQEQPSRDRDDDAYEDDDDDRPRKRTSRRDDDEDDDDRRRAPPSDRYRS